MLRDECLHERMIRPAVHGTAETVFLESCAEFARALRYAPERNISVADLIPEFRQRIAQYGNCPSIDYLKTVVALHAVVDFIALGWHLEVTEGVARLSSTDETRAATKDRIR